MMKKLEFISISSVRSRKRPFSYRSRINPVLIPYRSRIDPVSFPYRSPIVLLSFSLPEAETIRKQYGSDITRKGEGYVEGTWRIGGGRAYTTKITVSARR
jgi:hypothetical protein